VNNTRDEPMKDEGPDRHCLRPTRKGVMKCSACHDYNKGVRRGECFACGHKRFDVANLLSVLDGAELEKEVLTLSFEESIERRRWSEEEMSAAGVNTNAVLHCVRAVFANKALVHKEGSTRKDTAVDTSDIDLMVTLSNRRAMNDAQRDDLLRALRARVDVFRDVRLGRHAIKIQPHQGPSIDVVAHHSSFELSPTTLKYLAPAGTGFWGKPAVALAVSGIKIWWSAIKDGIELNVSVVAGQTPGSKSPLRGFLATSGSRLSSASRRLSRRKPPATKLQAPSRAGSTTSCRPWSIWPAMTRGAARPGATHLEVPLSPPTGGRSVKLLGWRSPRGRTAMICAQPLASERCTAHLTLGGRNVP